MKKLLLFFLVVMIVSGCADKAMLLSKGNILTTGTMVSPKTLTTGADGSFNDSEAVQLLNDSFRLYEVEQTPDGDNYKTDVLEAKVPGIIIQVERDQFLEIYGKNYFAATSTPNLGYSVLTMSADIKFEHMMELQLFPKDPQYRIKYSVNPYDLLRYQLRTAAGKRVFFLFQGFVCAPQILLKHTLMEAKTKADFPILFQGSHATLRREAESYGRRFIFRRYVDHEKLDRLLTGKDPMFVEASGTGSLSHGKNDVDPQLLLFKLGDKTYKLSDAYAKHLKAENVWFNCPQNPPIELLVMEPLGLKLVITKPAKVNDKPIILPRRQ